ncbi:hypothetical protein FFH21_015885 [Pseudomonas sp. KBS0707]|nr:hypothetical protein FFH21_015885 [Pseudomonas sp. KBS0707]
MGCEAVPKWATVVPDVPRAPFMLPVPGRSRTSGHRPAHLNVLKLAFMSHQETSASADTSVR